MWSLPPHYPNRTHPVVPKILAGVGRPGAFNDDGLPPEMVVFIENGGVSTRDVDRADAVVPAIAVIINTPITLNFQSSSPEVGMLKNGNDRSRLVAAAVSTGGPAGVYLSLVRVIAVPVPMPMAILVTAAMERVIYRHYPDRRYSVAPVVISSARPFASYYNVTALKMGVFKKQGLVASGNDNGVDRIIPIVETIICRPVAVKSQAIAPKIIRIKNPHRMVVCFQVYDKKEQA